MEKKNTGLICLIVILSLSVVGTGAFIIHDTLLSNNEVETNNWAVGGEEFLFTDGTEQNNIIAKIDANGITTTNLNAKKIYINSRDLASTIPVMANGKIPQSTTTAIKG